MGVAMKLADPVVCFEKGDHIYLFFCTIIIMKSGIKIRTVSITVVQGETQCVIHCGYYSDIMLSTLAFI